MLLSWCGWHLQVLCNLWKCWHKHVMKHLSPWWKKGVPRQRIRKWCHDNISVPVAHGDTGAKGSMAWAWHARWWGDPGYRVPTRRWHGNEEEHASDNFEHGANAGISCITNIRSRKVISAVIPLKRAFSKRVEFVKEVVIHGRRGTRSGSGRGTSLRQR